MNTLFSHRVIFPFMEKNQGLFGLVVSIIAILVTISIGVWAVKQVSQAVSERRIAARFGFYVHLCGYIDLFEAELKKGDALMSAFIINDLERQKFFGEIYTPNILEVDMFRDFCRKFRDFMLSSENNVPPPKVDRNDWSEHQIVLVKFLHKGAEIGKIQHFNNANSNSKAKYDEENKSVKDAIEKLKLAIRPEIGLKS